MSEVYANVSSWKEIAEVIEATKALENTPMTSIETTEMWTVGKDLYTTDVPMNASLAFNAGMYVGLLMAGIEVLIENGHCGSEAYNEQLIEAIDSLNLLMDAKGVGHMVDRCSITARLGARKWGPQFKAVFTKALNDSSPRDTREVFSRFLKSPVHGDIAECFKLRPPVKLIVS